MLFKFISDAFSKNKECQSMDILEYDYFHPLSSCEYQVFKENINALSLPALFYENRWYEENILQLKYHSTNPEWIRSVGGKHYAEWLFKKMQTERNYLHTVITSRNFPLDKIASLGPVDLAYHSWEIVYYLSDTHPTSQNLVNSMEKIRQSWGF